jgi:aromatic ring-opening dioxygenase LigB subunit
MKYILALLLVALPASADDGVFHHPDGSATISKEAKDKILLIHQMQNAQIEQLQRALKEAIDKSKKCIPV